MPSKQDRGAAEPATATSRSAFIEQNAMAIGQSWAEAWRLELHREGRPAAGGWPGTLREARMRVGHILPIEMRRREMLALTEPERELAARIAYASARGEWRKHIEPEIP